MVRPKAFEVAKYMGYALTPDADELKRNRSRRRVRVVLLTKRERSGVEVSGKNGGQPSYGCICLLYKCVRNKRNAVLYW